MYLPKLGANFGTPLIQNYHKRPAISKNHKIQWVPGKLKDK